MFIRVHIPLRYIVIISLILRHIQGMKAGEFGRHAVYSLVNYSCLFVCCCCCCCMSCDRIESISADMVTYNLSEG